MIARPGTLRKAISATVLALMVATLFYRIRRKNTPLTYEWKAVASCKEVYKHSERFRYSLSPRIPNLIHQIWKDSDLSTYPMKSSHEYWKEAFGPLNYTVKLWTDEDVISLIKRSYAWLYPTYEQYPHNIQRADLARLVVIHAEGGVYADLDLYPRSVDELECMQKSGYSGIFAPTGGNNGMSNHFFMAVQDSNFLGWALQEAKRRGSWASRWIWLPYLRVFWSTGPLMLTEAFQQYQWMFDGWDHGLALLDEEYCRKLAVHAAGRAWHGMDGYILNELADRVRWRSALAVIAFGLSMMIAVICARKRLRRLAAHFLVHSTLLSRVEDEKGMSESS